MCFQRAERRCIDLEVEVRGLVYLTMLELHHVFISIYTRSSGHSESGIMHYSVNGKVSNDPVLAASSVLSAEVNIKLAPANTTNPRITLEFGVLIMVVRIRLSRFGPRHSPFYNIVVAQARYVELFFFVLLNFWRSCP